MALPRNPLIAVVVWLCSSGFLFAAEGILDYNRFMSEIEPLITTKTYSSPGPAPMACLACHGDTAHPAYTAFPLVLGQSRDNFMETARRIELDSPDTSLLLLKPLALNAGGLPHGTQGKNGGAQFPNTTDATYQQILNWILDAKRASIGARVSRTEAHPNPFRYTTDIVYFLTTPALSAQVTIFTQSGHHLKRFIGTTRVGANFVTWDGRDEDLEPLPTGIYFYTVKAKFDDGTSNLNGSCIYTP